MGWLYLILLVILSSFTFYLGWHYVGQIKNRWWVFIALGALAVICAFAAFSHWPEWEYHIVPAFMGNFTESINYTPFATFFFGIAVGRVKRRMLKIELAFLALLIIVLGLIRMEWAYLDQKVYSSEQTVNRYGICFQTTGYTCGAASAVTLLRYFGEVTTEGEMARLSLSSPRQGVELVNLAWAIGKKLKPKGLAVDLVKTDWDGLKKAKLPCIVVIKYNTLVDHVVVVMEMKEDEVIIGDPLGDQHPLSKDKFLSLWRRNAIIVRKV